MEAIIIGAILALLVMWIVSVRHRLAGMEENVNYAMSQIGVQLSSRFDVLIKLLDLTQTYAAPESRSMSEMLKSHQRAITVDSTPEDVLKQENIIEEVLGHMSIVVAQHPELKSEESFTKGMDAVDSYEKMVHTSCLIYNDSVTRLNRELRMFPTFLLAGLLGFHQREYLEISDKN